MNEKELMLYEIVVALKDLGENGTLEEIYLKVEQQGKIDFLKYSDWQSRLRTTIYDHSSDTARFKEGKNDLFYTINGKGSGSWGIRTK